MVSGDPGLSQPSDERPLCAATQVEKLSRELAGIVEQLETKELRWLELAEIAGDI